MSNNHISYITDRMTQLSLMMSNGASPNALRSTSVDIIKDIKVTRKKDFTKTQRVAMLEKFTLLSQSPRPDLIIKEVLDTWHEAMNDEQ